MQGQMGRNAGRIGRLSGVEEEWRVGVGETMGGRSSYRAFKESRRGSGGGEAVGTGLGTGCCKGVYGEE